jgi:predicted  nucleic acid-binding Zn-ribbon protein
MSEEIRDIKESISFLAETQRILSESMLLQQQQFNEFQQVLNNSLQEVPRQIRGDSVKSTASDSAIGRSDCQDDRTPGRIRSAV